MKTHNLTPVFNLSGNTKESLIEEFAEMYTIIEEAADKLKKHSPNARNYRDGEHFQAAKEEFLADYKALKDMAEKYMNIAISLDK